MSGLDKRVGSYEEALEGLTDGMTVLAGGFGLCGIPENLIAEIRRRGVRDLTVVSNNCGVDGFGLGVLLEDRQIRKMIASYVGENALFEQQLLSGELEVELTPQGSLAEKIRAGGAGIPAFFTATGYGTPVAEGKEAREFNGRHYILEPAITGDFAIVKGWKADHFATSSIATPRRTSTRWSPPPGASRWSRWRRSSSPANWTRRRSTPPASTSTGSSRVASRNASRNARCAPDGGRYNDKRFPQMALTREQMAQRVARELKDGYYVNLGIGIPTLVANYVPEGIDVMLQSENGLLGMGAFPSEAEVDADMINAGKQTVTARVGASIFDSAQSFAMIRGGHVDLTVLGAFEVDVRGNIASWMIPGKLVKGMGGAMDLVAGAENIIVTMTHASKDGESKLLPYCTLPLTGCGCIRKVLTDLAYLEIEDGASSSASAPPGSASRRSWRRPPAS